MTDSVYNDHYNIRKRLFVKLAVGCNVYKPLTEKWLTLGRTDSLEPPFQIFIFKYLPGCIFFQTSFRDEFDRKEQTSWHIFKTKSWLIAFFNEHKLELICTNEFVNFFVLKDRKRKCTKSPRNYLQCGRCGIAVLCGGIFVDAPEGRIKKTFDKTLTGTGKLWFIHPYHIKKVFVST